jgi:transcriptional regulator with XRE-family HTH domain
MTGGAGAVHPLRLARQAVGFTRAELALASGISARMVRAVETGEKRPSQRTGEAFEKALLRAALAKIADVEQAVAACARLDQAAGHGNGRVRA